MKNKNTGQESAKDHHERTEKRAKLRRKVSAYIAGTAAVLSFGKGFWEATEPPKGPEQPTEAPVVDIERTDRTSPAYTNVDYEKGKFIMSTGGLNTNLPEVKASQEETAAYENHCEVADVHLDGIPTLKEAYRGAETPQAVTTERYLDAVKALKMANTREEVDSIVATVLGEAGIDTMFGGELGADINIEPAPADSPEELNSYNDTMKTLLSAYTYIPKGMMHGESVRFLNTGGWQQKDSDILAIGSYYRGDNRINLAARGATLGTVIHEYAHSAHSKACENYSDAELESEYNKAIGYIAKLKNEAANYSRFDEATANKLAGFPTDYSRESHVELLAELSEILFTGGYINGVKAAELPPDSAALRLQELVVERLQHTMPDVDLPAYLTFLSKFPDMKPNEFSPQDIAKNKISPYDRTYKMFAELQDDWPLSRAVEVNMDGQESYILAANNGEELRLELRKTFHANADRIIEDAARRYMERKAKETGGVVTYYETTGDEQFPGTLVLEVVSKEEYELIKKMREQGMVEADKHHFPELTKLK